MNGSFQPCHRAPTGHFGHSTGQYRTFRTPIPDTSRTLRTHRPDTFRTPHRTFRTRPDTNRTEPRVRASKVSSLRSDTSDTPDSFSDIPDTPIFSHGCTVDNCPTYRPVRLGSGLVRLGSYMVEPLLQANSKEGCHFECFRS